MLSHNRRLTTDNRQLTTNHHQTGDTKQNAKGKNKRRSEPGHTMKWKSKISIRAEAMTLTDERLYLAGPPDVARAYDHWGAFENRQGGALVVVSKKDGAELSRRELGSAPVYDGLAAAGGRLFLAMKDGSVLCLGDPER